MVIGFQQQFVSKILDGTKIHTIRQDRYHRWRTGVTMHMAVGVRTKNYRQFNIATCSGVGRIKIRPGKKQIYINGMQLSDEEIKMIARNDGFLSVEDFWNWFDKPFTGRLIHWSDFRYL